MFDYNQMIIWSSNPYINRLDRRSSNNCFVSLNSGSVILTHLIWLNRNPSNFQITYGTKHTN